MITIQSSGLCPSNNQDGIFPNFAGPQSDLKDDAIEKELIDAGIDVEKHNWIGLRNREVKTFVAGSCGPWWFDRAWYYWIAGGPGIPPQFANELHEKYGKVVRVDGDCSCPSPYERFKGFAVGHYHVDTPEGLKALADTIKKVIQNAL
jgi:hypothetical protein